MWSSFVTKLAIFALNRTDLQLKDRDLITSALLDGLRISPLADILSVSEQGEMHVAGKPLSFEKIAQLRNAARTELDNPSLLPIREQVKYEAFVGGSIKSTTPMDMLFYRAALWWGQTEQKYLHLLAQKEEPDL